MTADLQLLKLIRDADVYKGGTLAGHLSRTREGGVRFSYNGDYLDAGLAPVGFSLPLATPVVETGSGGLPPFFAGLLPEGHRLTVLRNAAKTSYDDELTLLLAVGADVPGDVQVVPSGKSPIEPESLADASTPENLDFSALANSVDRHGLPGVQDKASASMLTTPLAVQGMRYLLKLDPVKNPHLVINEAAHLAGAKGLKIPVVNSRVVQDKNGRSGLLVERFDRAKDSDGGWKKLPLEDAAQVLGVLPAAKYRLTSEEVTEALALRCQAPAVAKRSIYLQFIYAWLTGNGDLHAKNLSILGNSKGTFTVAPVYDVPCTLLYGDDTLALSIAGKVKNLRARHWAEFADVVGLPQKAAAAANVLALRAANSVSLSRLPFSGSPLNAALRELRFRRAEFAD